MPCKGSFCFLFLLCLLHLLLLSRLYCIIHLVVWNEHCCGLQTEKKPSKRKIIFSNPVAFKKSNSLHTWWSYLLIIYLTFLWYETPVLLPSLNFHISLSYFLHDTSTFNYFFYSEYFTPSTLLSYFMFCLIQYARSPCLISPTNRLTENDFLPLFFITWIFHRQNCVSHLKYQFVNLLKLYLYTLLLLLVWRLLPTVMPWLLLFILQKKIDRTSDS